MIVALTEINRNETSPDTCHSQERQMMEVTSSNTTEEERAEEKNDNRIYVEHKYDDHSNDPIMDGNNHPSFSCSSSTIDRNCISAVVGITSANKGTQRRGPRGGVLDPFPVKLYEMLSQVENDGVTDIVNWQPHGRCFIIHQPKKFVEEVMPKYFKQSKFTSFQRQVNLYGFRRLTRGKDRGGYYHELFLRGRADLCKQMIRTRIKGTGTKAASSPTTEPDFYKMKPCDSRSPKTTNHCLETWRKSRDQKSFPQLSLTSMTPAIMSLHPLPSLGPLPCPVPLPTIDNILRSEKSETDSFFIDIRNNKDNNTSFSLQDYLPTADDILQSEDSDDSLMNDSEMGDEDRSTVCAFPPTSVALQEFTLEVPSCPSEKLFYSSPPQILSDEQLRDEIEFLDLITI